MTNIPVMLCLACQGLQDTSLCPPNTSMSTGMFGSKPQALLSAPLGRLHKITREPIQSPSPTTAFDTWVGHNTQLASNAPMSDAAEQQHM